MTAKGHNNPCSYNAIIKNDELLLWQNNVFDLNTSKGLSYAVFYYVGKVFGVRGASEHHQLEAEQFSFLADEQGSYVQFEERRVKTNQGGISHKRYAPRKVQHYEVEGNTCVYKILLKYFELHQLHL